MRQLSTIEINFVAGGTSGCNPPPPPPCQRTKNNNGYGNGPESGPAPGNSGDHNPQLRSGPDVGGMNTGTKPGPHGDYLR